MKALERIKNQRAATYKQIESKLLNKELWARMIPKEMDPDRQLRLYLGAVAKNPKLLDCKPESILAAFNVCASLGLEPIGRCGVWLIPYKDQCQAITDYRAEIMVALRSDFVVFLDAHPIYSGDHWEYVLSNPDPIVHKPAFLRQGASGLEKEERGELVGVYAFAKTKHGDKIVRCLTIDEVNRYRSRSKSWSSNPNSSPWSTDYEAMALKTVVRRLTNWLPMVPDYRAQMQREEAVEYGESSPVIDVSPSAPILSTPEEEAGAAAGLEIEKAERKAERALHQYQEPPPQPEEGSAEAVLEEAVQVKEEIEQKEKDARFGKLTMRQWNAWLKKTPFPKEEAEATCATRFHASIPELTDEQRAELKALYEDDEQALLNFQAAKEEG